MRIRSIGRLSWKKHEPESKLGNLLAKVEKPLGRKILSTIKVLNAKFNKTQTVAAGLNSQPLYTPKLESADIQKSQLGLRDTLQHFHLVAAETNPGTPLIRFFKLIVLKIAHILHLVQPQQTRKAEIDTGLLSQVLRSGTCQTECPRLVAMEYIKQFFQTDSSSQATADKFNSCFDYMRRIDELQKTKNRQERSGKLETLEVEIKTRVAQLTDGSSLLLPGGWWQKDKFCDGLMEIAKSGSTFTVRFISTDEAVHPYSLKTVDPITKQEKICPHFTYQGMEEAEVLNSLSPLLRLQLPSEFSNSMPWLLTFLPKNFALGLNYQLEGLRYDSDNMPQMFNPLFVASMCYGKGKLQVTDADKVHEDSIQQTLASNSSKGNTVKNLLAFYRIHNPEQYRQTKLRLEISTFLEVLHQCEGALVDTALRCAIADSARRLRYQLAKQKFKGLISAQLQEELETKIEHVQNKIKQIEQDAALKLHQADKWSLDTPLAALEITPVKALQIRALSHSAPPTIATSITQTNPATQRIPADAIEPALKQRLGKCQELYDAEDFTALESYCRETVFLLPLMTDIKPVEDKDKESLATQTLRRQYFELNRFLFEAHLGTRPPQTLPHTMLAFRKLELLMQNVSPAFLDHVNVNPSLSSTKLKQIQFPSALQPEAHSILTYKEKKIRYREVNPILFEADKAGDNAKMATILEAMAVGQMRNIVFSNLNCLEARASVDTFLKAGLEFATGKDNQAISRSLCKKELAKSLGMGSNGHRKFHDIVITLKPEKERTGWEDVTVSCGNKLTVKQYASIDSCNDYGKPITEELMQKIMGDSEWRRPGESQAMKCDDPIQRDLILCFAPRTPIQRTIRSFFSNPHLFDNPSFVRLFEIAVFPTFEKVFEDGRINNLCGVLQDKPDLLIEIGNSVHREFTLALQCGHPKRATALFEMALKLQDAATYALADKPQALAASKLPSLTNWENLETYWFAQLRANAVTPDEQAFVSLQYLSWLSIAWSRGLVYRQNISLPNVLQAHFGLGKAMNGTHTVDHDMRKEAALLMERLTPDIDRLSQAERRQIALQLAKQSNIQLPDDFEVKGSYPLWHAGNVQFDLVRGLTLQNGTARYHLSDTVKQEIAERPHLKFLQQQNISEVGKLSLVEDPASNKMLSIFVPDSHPQMRIITCTGQITRVQQKITQSSLLGLRSKETWYELLPIVDELTLKSVENPTDYQSIASPAGTVLDNCTVWHQVGSPQHALALEAHSNTPIYDLSLRLEAGKKYKLISLARLSDGLTLKSPTNAMSKDPQYGQLFGIESPKHTSIWCSGTVPKIVQYPRLKTSNGLPLTFNVAHEKVEGDYRLVLKPTAAQFRNWRLSVHANRTQKTPHIFPETFKQFQWLESPTDTSKALLTIQELLPFDPEQGEGAKNRTQASPWLNRVYFDRRETDVGPQRLLVTDVDVLKHRLVAPNKEGAAMLSYLFFAHKEFTQALEYWNSSLSGGVLSENHVDILKWMIRWPDHSPESSALKLRALIALDEHLASLPKQSKADKEEEQESAKAAQDICHRYLLDLDKVPTELKLNETELLHFSGAHYKTQAPEITKAQILDARNYLYVDIHGAAKRLWFMGIQQKHYPPRECIPLYSDQYLIDHFVSLYEWLSQPENRNPDSAVVKSLKACRPGTITAFTLKKLLLSVVKADKGEVIPKFPKEIFDKVPYKERLAPIRLASLITNRLPDNVEKLTHFFQSVRNLPPKREEQTIAPKPTWREVLHIVVANLKAAINHRYGPEKIKEPTTVQMKEASARVRSTNLSTYLKDNPATGTTPIVFSANHQQASFVLPFGNSRQSLVASGLLKTVASEKTQPLMANDIVRVYDDTATKRLINDFVKDTVAFREKRSFDLVKLGNSTQIKQLKTSTAQALASSRTSSTGSKVLEKNILDMLNTAILRKGVAQVQEQRLNKIPDRLLGLHSQGRIAEVNHLFQMNFSAEVLQELDTMIEQFMVASIRERVLARLDTCLKSLPWNPANAEISLVKEIADLVSTQRFYTLNGPDSHPLARKLLLIEYKSDFVLREGQVRTLQMLLSGKNRVRQLAMGEGKTTILLPALLNSYADGSHLAMGLIPEWLWDIVPAELEQTCNTLFGQRVHRFEYNEKSAIDPVWLTQQINLLSQTIRDKDVLITTRTHLLSFRNKYLELLHHYYEMKSGTDAHAKTGAILAQMAEVINLFKQRGRMIADEVDALLDVRKRHIRALGDEVRLPEILRSSGNELYQRMSRWADHSTHPVLRTFGIALRSNKQAQVYPDCADTIKRALAEECFDAWSKTWPRQAQTVDKATFVAYLTGIHFTDELKAKLKLDKAGIPAFVNKLKTHNEDLFEQICYTREFVGHALDSVCRLENGVHYGRGEDGISTKFFRGINQPTKDKFGNRYEDILLHCQDYLQTGVSLKQAQRFIQARKQDIEMEIRRKLINTGEPCEIEDTLTYKRFRAAYPSIDFAKVARDSAEIARFASILNETSTSRLAFLETWVLPTMTASPRQTSSCPSDLLDFCCEFSAFTGTPWNPDTYPKELDISEINDVGTDGKTIDFLLSAFNNKQLTIKTLSSFDESKPVESVTSLDGFWNTYDALIDVGAYIKGPKNDEAALQLAQSAKNAKSNKAGIVLVNSEEKLVFQDMKSGRQMPLSERTDVPIKDRFCYIPQSHSIGMNVKNHQTARAAVSIGPLTTWTDFNQGIWRLRQLRQGQQIDIILKPEIRHLIRPFGGAVTMTDILHFLMNNQAQRLGKDNYNADIERIHRILPRSLFWNLIDRFVKKEPVQRNMLKLADKHLYRENEEPIESLAAVGKKEKPTHVLQRLVTAQEAVCSAASSAVSMQPFIQEALDALHAYEVLPDDKLPEAVDTTVSHTAGTSIQQQQQQQVAIVEAEASDAKDRENPYTRLCAGLPYHGSPTEDLRPVAHFLGSMWDERLLFSDALIGSGSLMNDEKETGKIEKMLTAPRRNEVARLLVVRTLKGTQAVMLDLQNSDYIVNWWWSWGTKYALYDISGPCRRTVIKSSAKENTDPFADDKDVINLVGMAKVFGGMPQFYDPKEAEGALKFLTAHPDKKEELRHLFEGKLMNGIRRLGYNSLSPIYRYFHPECAHEWEEMDVNKKKPAGFLKGLGRMLKLTA